MRGTVKGGVWKNTEDEILKVAVMKYGKNQWARISSLLVRKTPKQCKARWYEWIDPSIKKTDWSREEEEKLLHLAKIMPTQWRTIAPIVGRTAAQCLEHYEHLLDAAQDSSSGGGSASASVSVLDDPRRLRPGEIDTTPETKPARPDPVDMDEDEKEMLSEARARLANTQGKKAKRKAREKQLEEARRLASLQKRRELKAAGIYSRGPRIRGMNYNVDIPFERKPPPGFFDTTAELQREKEEKSSGHRIRPKVEKRRLDMENDERRKDHKKQKEASKVSTNAAEMAKLKQMTEEKFSKKLGGKLSLPAPTLGDQEVEQFVKLGLSSEEARMMILEGATPASSSLMSDYRATPLRTPGSQTPRSALSTPLRQGTGQASLASESHRLSALRKQLELGFSKLPLPKNDFDIIVPELAVADESFLERGKGDRLDDFVFDRSLPETEGLPDHIEDAMDRDLKMEQLRRMKEVSKYKRQPLAVQKGLAFPRNFSHVPATRFLKQDPLLFQAISLVQHEMTLVLEQQQASLLEPLDIYGSCSDLDIQRIHDMIDKELASLKQSFLPDMSLFSQRHTGIWESVYDAPTDVIELPMELLSRRQYETGLIESASLVTLSHEERIEALKSEFYCYREQMVAQAAKAKSLESILAAKLSPLSLKSSQLSAKIVELGEQIEQTRMDTIMSKIQAATLYTLSN